MNSISPVIVTGASCGLGLAAARLLVEQGTPVVAVSRSLERLQAAFASFSPELQALILPVAADVSLEESPAFIFAAAEAHGWATPSGLINNAGQAFFANVEAMSLADWNRLLANNLTSAFLMCSEAVRRWKEQKISGAIVNVSSVTANLGGPMVSAYAAAKAGLIAFTKCLAKETAACNIRANVICPGAMDTPMFHNDTIGTFVKLYKREPEQLIRGTLSMVPMHRLVEADEAAAMALMLLSDQASAVTGQSLNVDCGYDMR